MRRIFQATRLAFAFTLIGGIEGQSGEALLGQAVCIKAGYGAGAPLSGR